MSARVEERVGGGWEATDQELQKELERRRQDGARGSVNRR
jgi:hypothetical protein